MKIQYDNKATPQTRYKTYVQKISYFIRHI
jgi:hypothetical protein